jgi:hypothetical protein
VLDASGALDCEPHSYVIWPSEMISTTSPVQQHPPLLASHCGLHWDPFGQQLYFPSLPGHDSFKPSPYLPLSHSVKQPALQQGPAQFLPKILQHSSPTLYGSHPSALPAASASAMATTNARCILVRTDVLALLLLLLLYVAVACCLELGICPRRSLARPRDGQPAKAGEADALRASFS